VFDDKVYEMATLRLQVHTLLQCTVTVIVRHVSTSMPASLRVTISCKSTRSLQHSAVVSRVTLAALVSTVIIDNYASASTLQTLES
jgi:hypothetical protein